MLVKPILDNLRRWASSLCSLARKVKDALHYLADSTLPSGSDDGTLRPKSTVAQDPSPTSPTNYLPLEKQPENAIAHSAANKPREIKPNKYPTSPLDHPTSRFSPALTCSENLESGCWEVTLEIQDQYQLVNVKHKEEILAFSEGQCQIPSLTGRLSVSSRGGQEWNIPLFIEQTPLIFKFGENWAGVGRKSEKIISGYYVVIAPKEWKPEGRVPIEPQPCADHKFIVHFLYRETNESETEPLRIGPWSPRTEEEIKLTGRSIFDDSTRGRLFVGLPPELTTSRQIDQVQIKGGNCWIEDFTPEEKSLAEVLGAREGRFLLRAYSLGRAVDCMYFRYTRSLVRIEVDGKEYSQETQLAPAEGRHVASEVGLIDSDCKTVMPALPLGAKQTVLPSGKIKIPPHPDAEHVFCRLGSDEHDLEIVLNLPRVWWGLQCNDDNAVTWRDSDLEISRSKFKEYARAGVSILFLSKRQTEVFVQFDCQKGSSYRRRRGEECIKIPLSDFTYHTQILFRLKENACLNVMCGNQIIPLIVVQADHKTEPGIISFTAESETIVAGEGVMLEWITRNADGARVEITPHVGAVESKGVCTVLPDKTTIYKLTVQVIGSKTVKKEITVKVNTSPRGDPASLPAKSIMKIKHKTSYSVQIEVSPLERGYGHTLGNALRRVMLSSVPGAAPSEVRIAGKVHESERVEGMSEDIMELLLNVRGIAFKLNDTDTETVVLDAVGPLAVTAGLINLPSNVAIVNPDHVLAHLSEGAVLKMEITVKSGKGYVPAAVGSEGGRCCGVIRLDASYSPVRQVSFEVENARMVNHAGMERLMINVHTNGTFDAENIIRYSADLLIHQLRAIAEHERGATKIGKVGKIKEPDISPMLLDG